MTASEAPSEFCRAVPLEDIDEGGLEMEVAAESSERAALAARFGLVSVDELSARLRLEAARESAGAVRISGRIRGRVVQTCVATLEPVPQTIREPLLVLYAPIREDAAQREVEVEAGDTPAVEPLPEGTIDVGELVAQHLALALDPYPRHPDASGEPLRYATGEAAADGPFAALGHLKGKL